MDLTIKKKQLKTQRKQLTISNTNSPWAYIREGLLSEGYLRLRSGGLSFGRAYYHYFILVFFSIFW